MKTVIIGAGLAGLSAAHHLKGDWTILEQAGKVGGLAGSDKVGDFTFDRTGHLLHMHNPYTKAWLIEGLLKGRMVTHQRNSWIYSKRVFTRYPFQANTYGLPPKVVTECVASFMEARDRYPTPTPSHEMSLQRWSLETFGKGISRHFMLPYNEKLWRFDMKKMSTEWLGKFVPVPSREEVLYGALADQKKFFGYNANFYYPASEGIQALPDAIANNLEGSAIHLNCEAVEIDIRAKRVHTHQGSFSYDWLINTSPLNVFLKRLRPGIPEALARVQDKSMPYTVVYNLNLGLNNPRPDDKHWVYFPEKRYPFYRVGISSNFAPKLSPKGASAFYVEFARRPGESFNYKAMFAQTLKALREFGWMRPKDEVIMEHWNRIEPAYVIFNSARRDFVRSAFDFLEAHQVLSIGRYGAWKYSFMEEAVLDGKAAAEKILNKEGLALREG